MGNDDGLMPFRAALLAPMLAALLMSAVSVIP